MDHFEIAIVGAGISGLMAATYLAEKGKNSVIFDKGRGPGGRMSTGVLGNSGWIMVPNFLQFAILVSKSMFRVGRKLGWRKSGARGFLVLVMDIPDFAAQKE